MQLNRLLKYVVYSGVFLLPFIPFLVADNFFFPFIVGKNLAFRVLVEIVVASWAILALRNPEYRPRRSWFLWIFSAFVFVMLLANILGVNVGRSFWSNFERMEGFVTLLHLFGYVLVASSVLNKKVWARLFATSIGASVIMGVYGIFQLAGVLKINQGGVRVDGTFGNATYLAVYMLFHMFLSLFMFTKSTSKFQRVFYSVAFLLEGAILYFTATRGAILGLFGGLLLSGVLVALFERENKKLRRGAIIGIVLLVIMAGGFFAMRNTSAVQNSQVLRRFSRISLQEKTTRSRLVLWQLAIHGALERPILGWGQENFDQVFDKYYDPRMFDQEQWFDRAHNVVLDWFVSGGVLGVGLYLALFISALVLLWRKTNLSVTQRSIATGLLVGYFFHNLFVFDNVVSYLLFGTVLGFIYNESTTAPKEEPSRVLSVGVANRILSPLIVLFFVVSLYVFNVPGARAGNALLKALRLQGQEGGAQSALETYKLALSYDTYADQEIREQIINFAQQVRQREDVPDELKLEIFKTADGEMKKQIEETPGRVREHLFLGSLLGSYGLLEDSETHLREAVRLSPAKQSVRFALVNNLLVQGRVDEAISLAKETYELLPEADSVLKAYAVILIRSGQGELAEELLLSSFGTSYITDDAFINAYATIGDLDTLLELWRLRAEQNPSDLQARISYAATLTELGRRDEAVDVLEQAVADFPDFSTKGQQIIEALRSGQL